MNWPWILIFLFRNYGDCMNSSITTT
jgi:hypothetical protein